jgi:hypothetical protein
MRDVSTSLDMTGLGACGISHVPSVIPSVVEESLNVIQGVLIQAKIIVRISLDFSQPAEATSNN